MRAIRSSSAPSPRACSVPPTSGLFDGVRRSRQQQRAYAASPAWLLLAVYPFGACGADAAEAPSPESSPAVICHLVDDAAAANRLPAGFLARVLWQESRFRSEATSRAGAEGVAQFMPQTATERGLADPRDNAPAVAAAAR